MAQVQMQVYRGTSDYLDTISNVNGQFLYDEDTHQILVDNGTTREQYGGGNEKVYDTYAEAVADLANIADGQTVFVKEGTSSDKPTISYADWQQLSDIEKEAFSGYVSNFPEEQLNASAITYGNTNVGAELTSINTQLSNLPKIKTYNYVNSQASPSGIFVVLTSNIPANARVLGVNGSPLGKQFDVYHDGSGRTCIAMRDPVSLALDTTNGINVKVDYIEN